MYHTTTSIHCAKPASDHIAAWKSHPRDTAQYSNGKQKHDVTVARSHRTNNCYSTTQLQGRNGKEENWIWELTSRQASVMKSSLGFAKNEQALNVKHFSDPITGELQFVSKTRSRSSLSSEIIPDLSHSQTMRWEFDLCALHGWPGCWYKWRTDKLPYDCHIINWWQWYWSVWLIWLLVIMYH